MADATTQVLGHAASDLPRNGTWDMEANTLLLGGTMVALNSSQRATTVAANGNPIMGRSKATYDNRTNAPYGMGAAGAMKAQVEFGVIWWAGETGKEPRVGDVVYAADNQTVSRDSAAGTRGLAGVCVAVGPVPGSGATRYGIAMGPHIIAAITADREGTLLLPVTAFTNAGAPLVAFANGTADGLSVVDSEVLGYRWNDTGGTRAVLWTSVALPRDLDPAADINISILAFRVGANDITAAFTVGAYIQSVGALDTVGTNIGGTSSALAAATGIVTESTLALASANLVAPPAGMTLTLTPTAALDQDDLVLMGVRITYKRRPR